jgi:hypothetical protein
MRTRVDIVDPVNTYAQQHMVDFGEPHFTVHTRPRLTLAWIKAYKGGALIGMLPCAQLAKPTARLEQTGG